MAEWVISENIIDWPVLFCTREGADTRMILHASHPAFSDQKETVGIDSADTDVSVLPVQATGWPILKLPISNIG